MMHVLVSGAGIAGPTLAWFLAKAGIRSTVIEKAPNLVAQGHNIDIQGSAVFVARKMGVLEEVSRLNTKEEGSRFLNTDGKAYASFPITEGRTASLTSEYEILRGDLATVLYNATKSNPLVEYRFGTTIQKVIKNNERIVEVELEGGERQTFDLLVAADGQWSKLRKQCFSPEDLKVVETGMYSAWWTIPRIPSDVDWWDICLGPKSKNMAIRPDPHGSMRVLASCMTSNETQKKQWQSASRGDRKSQQELLRQEFADFGWQAERLLEGMAHAPDLYMQEFQQIKMSKWSQGRVVCLGDAGYAPTPMTGMGTSLAMNGAFVLAGELSKVKDNNDIRSALLNYEAVFRSFVEEAQKIPVAPDLLHPGGKFKLWLLQTGIQLGSLAIAGASAIPWLKSSVSKPTGEDFPLPKYKAFEDDKFAVRV